MKTIVIGGGLIGVTTAYFLRRQGHQVTVLDRAEGPGQETSFANGALLTPSMSDPWNAPGVWRLLLASIGRSSAPIQLRLRALPGYVSWGATFLRNSNAATYERNTISNLRLSLYSLEVMHSLQHHTGIEFGGAAVGALKLYRNPAALDRASEIANALLAEGLRFRKLSPRETVEIEPALAPIEHRLAGAINYGVDETGDAYRFCVALADHARQQGVDFRFRTEVSSLDARAGRVLAAMCNCGRFVADRYIVATGSYSAPLLRRVGINLPVRPVKGYSLTFDGHQGPQSLRIPVIDDHRHTAIVPIGNAIRIAGTAEFTGYNLTLNRDRIHSLLTRLKEVLPSVQFDPATGRPWCGLRAMSADGVPIIGPTAIMNLLVNTGHGHLGWTMAAGSARLLADLMSGVSPSIDPAPYDLKRFV